MRIFFLTSLFFLAKCLFYSFDNCLFFFDVSLNFELFFELFGIDFTRLNLCSWPGSRYICLHRRRSIVVCMAHFGKIQHWEPICARMFQARIRLIDLWFPLGTCTHSDAQDWDQFPLGVEPFDPGSSCKLPEIVGVCQHDS